MARPPAEHGTDRRYVKYGCRDVNDCPNFGVDGKITCWQAHEDALATRRSPDQARQHRTNSPSSEPASELSTDAGPVPDPASDTSIETPSAEELVTPPAEGTPEPRIKLGKVISVGKDTMSVLVGDRTYRHPFAKGSGPYEAQDAVSIDYSSGKGVVLGRADDLPPGSFAAGVAALSNRLDNVLAQDDDDGPLFDVRACRVCGCTDDDCSNCIEKTGEPCSWVEWDLCSACDNQTASGDAEAAQPLAESAQDTEQKAPVVSGGSQVEAMGHNAQAAAGENATPSEAPSATALDLNPAAATPRPAAPLERGRVTSRGATRRLQGLVYIGYSPAALAERTLISQDAIWWLLVAPPASVADSTHRVIVDVYRSRKTEPVLAQGDSPEGRSAERARMLAVDFGWVSPFAWDDIDTDTKPVFTRRHARTDYADTSQTADQHPDAQQTIDDLHAQLAAANTLHADTPVPDVVVDVDQAIADATAQLVVNHGQEIAELRVAHADAIVLAAIAHAELLEMLAVAQRTIEEHEDTPRQLATIPEPAPAADLAVVTGGDTPVRDQLELTVAHTADGMRLALAVPASGRAELQIVGDAVSVKFGDV